MKSNHALAGYFSALADDLRCAILLALKEGEMTATELTRRLKCRPNLLSYDLKILARAGFVHCRREGVYRHYSLNWPAVGTILAQAESRSGVSPADNLDFVADSTPLCFYEFDRTGRLTMVRGHAMNRFGLKPEDFLGRNFREILKHVPEAVEAAERALAGEALNTRIAVSGFVYDVSLRPKRAGKKGRVTGVFGVSVDVTDKVAAELNLKETDEKLKGILTNAADLVLAFDETGRIVFANREYHRLTPEKAVGRNVHEFVLPEFRDAARNAIVAASRTGQPRLFHGMARTADGRLVRYLVRVSPPAQIGGRKLLVAVAMELPGNLTLSRITPDGQAGR